MRRGREEIEGQGSSNHGGSLMIEGLEERTKARDERGGQGVKMRRARRTFREMKQGRVGGDRRYFPLCEFPVSLIESKLLKEESVGRGKEKVRGGRRELTKEGNPRVS